MTFDAKIALAVLKDGFEKDLAQAKSNYTGADYGTIERYQLEGVISSLTRVVTLIEALMEKCDV